MGIDVSFVIPSFNAGKKLSACLKSLESVHAVNPSIEAIFVDDSSSDNTLALLRDFARGRNWVSVLETAENTGSPSVPRNLGIEKSCGEYVFFLDADDELLVDGFMAECALAFSSNADVVRAPLIRRESNRDLLLNRIQEWNPDSTIVDKLKQIFQYQSTTVCGLIRRSLLESNGVRWNPELRMGEDTVFWAKVLAHANSIEYSDLPDFVYRVVRYEGDFSSTQSYGDRELRNHLAVWTQVESELSSRGFSYFEIRGQVALQTCLRSLIRNNSNGISRVAFEELRRFLKVHQSVVDSFDYRTRLSEIVGLIFEDDYVGFLEQIKERLVIAGYDLKFIKGAVPSLQDIYQVQMDEWSGHETHDEAKSLRLLEWADVIHCEWLLGNAVWFSKRKKPQQRLVVRTHLFEMTREYGDQIEVDSVDRFIAVSLPTLEDIQQRFNFPRERIRLVPNFVDIDSYENSSDPEKLFNLAIVGILPARKGFHRALNLLASLRQIDSRYNLTVYGKKPDELAWVANDPIEAKYFEECERLIDEKSLSGAVHFPGWSDMKAALADKGFVLSVSDFESFHVAPAEAFASGNCALFLPWRGVEYIYPNKYVFKSVESMREKILSLRSIEDYEEFSKEGQLFVANNYSLERFVESYDSLLRSI